MKMLPTSSLFNFVCDTGVTEVATFLDDEVEADEFPIISFAMVEIL